MASSIGSPVPAPGSPNSITPATSAAVAVAGNGREVIDTTVIRQRIPLTIDPLGQNGQALASYLISARAQAVANLFNGMQEVRGSLKQLLTSIATPTAPSQLLGVILQPDGTTAARVQVQFDPATLGKSSPKITVQTDDTGAFHLPLPAGLPLPVNGSLDLVIHGANSVVTVHVPSAQIAANGLAGAILLPHWVAPLPVSILAALQAIAVPTAMSTPTKLTHDAQLPVIRVGEDACLLSFGLNSSTDSFPFGVFYRLVEPRASIVSQARFHPLGNNRFTLLPSYASSAGASMIQPQDPQSSPGSLPAIPPTTPGEGQVTYVDRVPVEQPISVDGFRDQMMGLQPNGTFTADELRPMAGTLGLGYVLWMSQRWNLQGLALGDLVYSLPLAPGEQQQVAIFERVDTARVSESEFFSEQQAQEQRALADTSTQATFQSAFNEAVNGSSYFHTDSNSSSWGGSLILLSGGSGSSSATGTSTQSLEGQRNSAQQAAQTTHSSAENQASARRSATRTGMRIATASESEQITTKVVTNHNHTRALTMQYWEVQRLYDVTTAIDGLTLTVLVPLQVVRFMPPGQPLVLTDPSQVNSRARVMARYGEVVKHGDVLAQALPRRFQHGLTMLLQFASDPTASVEAFGSPAEDVIQFGLRGSFLSCEDVSISAVTDRGTRVGPIKLANPAPNPPADQFVTREQLIGWLTTKRREVTGVTLTGALALPRSMNRANIVGFEISRTFHTLSYTLISPAMAELQALQNLFGANNSWITQALESTLSPGTPARETLRLSPSDLESLVGGPELHGFVAAISETDSSGNMVPSTQEQYANDTLTGVVLPPEAYPVPALQLAPVLRYNEILEIERMAQHVARQTLHYSRAVWSSMSDDERAILLEAYTIGVPSGGVQDASQMVPLLNCVENRVLGYFGNSMVLPFIIPEALAEQTATDGETLHPAQIQEALLAYQVEAFTPPKSTIALPTRGVLGEAVLGHCSAAEKIDITRFWNWQDSPADSAPGIAPSTLPTTTPSIAAGITAPNTLSNLPSLINNVLTAPTPDTALLDAISKAALGQQDFSSSLTGAEQLAALLTNAQNTANQARSDALKTTKDLTAQAMATVGNIYGGTKGNPNAGSNAAAAVTGNKAPDAGNTQAGTNTQQTKGNVTSGPGGGPTGSSSGGAGSNTGGSAGGTGSAGGSTSGSGGSPGGGPPGPPSGGPVAPSGVENG